MGARLALLRVLVPLCEHLSGLRPNAARPHWGLCTRVANRLRRRENAPGGGRTGILRNGLPTTIGRPSLVLYSVLLLSYTSSVSASNEIPPNSEDFLAPRFTRTSGPKRKMFPCTPASGMQPASRDRDFSRLLECLRSAEEPGPTPSREERGGRNLLPYRRHTPTIAFEASVDADEIPLECSPDE